MLPSRQRLRFLIAEVNEVAAAESIKDDHQIQIACPAWQACEARHPQGVRLVPLEVLVRQSAALQTGARLARGSIVATLDGDGQNDPAFLPEALARLSCGDVAMVAGQRTGRQRASGVVQGRQIASRSPKVGHPTDDPRLSPTGSLPHGVSARFRDSRLTLARESPSMACEHRIPPRKGRRVHSRGTPPRPEANIRCSDSCTHQTAARCARNAPMSRLRPMRTILVRLSSLGQLASLSMGKTVC